MRNTMLTLVLLLVIAGPAAASGASLRVRVLGLASDDGSVVAALFDGETAFDSGAEALRRETVPVAGGECEFELAGLPYGDYALKLYHDVNGNGELDRNGFGAPVEPYGFSNDARGKFGPPRWKKVRFKIREPVKEITVRVR